MLQLRSERLHPGERIADRRRQRRLAGDAAELDSKPGLQIVEHRLGLGLAGLCSYVWRRAPDRLLNGAEIGDPLYHSLSDGRPLGLVHIDEPAPAVRHPRDFCDAAGPIQTFEAGTAIRLHPAGDGARPIRTPLWRPQNHSLDRFGLCVWYDPDR